MVQSKHFKSLTETQLLNKVSAEYVNKLLPMRPYTSTSGTSTVGVRLVQAVRHCAGSGCTANSVLLICGSLFVAADAREALYKLQPNLFKEVDWVRECDPDVPF
jgi:hypothetical protein